MKKSIKFIILLAIAGLFFGNNKVQSQIIYNYDYSKYKKVVRIGIYVSPKANLHTRLITDIAHYYEEEKASFDKALAMPIKDSPQYEINNRKVLEYQKMRSDSADVFERLFTGAASFISLNFNRSTSIDQKINFDDTMFIPSVKVEAIDNERAMEIIRRDTLDYFINIQNINSTKNGFYFNVAFKVSIQPKLKRLKPFVKNLVIPFINLQKSRDPFFYCSQPFECLQANSIYLLITTVTEKLYHDGYRKNDYESYKKEKGLK